MKTTMFILAGVLAAGALSGCATTGRNGTEASSTKQGATDAKSAETKPENKPQANKDDEYVYYYPTGSWVPVKVKKSAVKPTKQETQDSQDGLRELQRKGAKLPKDG